VSDWTFFTNHAHVLVCITQNPEIRVSEIARSVGIGERAVHNIVADLVEAGYVTRTKQGRRNRYSVDLAQPLRHPLEAEHLVADVFVPFVES
jgi:DNA-binding IclR family transcriptional regulator